MQAAAYLSTDTECQRLDEALGDRLQLTHASSWSEFDQLIRRTPVEVVIVDPVRPEGVETAAVERLRAYYPSLSVVLYMSFSPELASALLRLGAVGVHSAVFFDHGDTPLALSRAVGEAIAGSTSEQILMRIFTGFEPEPSQEIIEAFREALQNVDRIRTALEWSKHRGLSHRSFYRLFQSQQLPTPKTCLLWLRLMYAVRLLEDPGYSLYDVVHRLGYSAPSNFWQHVQDTLGLKASELRYAVGFETLLSRFLAQRYRTPDLDKGSAG